MYSFFNIVNFKINNFAKVSIPGQFDDFINDESSMMAVNLLNSRERERKFHSVHRIAMTYLYFRVLSKRSEYDI